MFVHIMHASLTVSQTLMVVNSDNDVVVVDLAGVYCNHLDGEERADCFA